MSWPPEWARGLVAGEVDEASLYLAIEAGSWPEELPRGERRAFALLVLALRDAQGEGATRLRLDATAERLVRLGAADDDRREVARLVARLAVSATAVPPRSLDAPLAPSLAAFFGRSGDYRPFIVDDGCLYDERTLRLELRLADGLGARLHAAERALAPADLERAMDAARDPAGRRWTAAQQAAIEAACRREVAVVTGGPGTGKTAVIGAVVRAFIALGVSPEEIAIAAPTGKAAKRIAELLPAGLPVPSTLHRLLGTSARAASTRGGAFRHHANRPLPHRAVIVDEASMVGLALAERLVRALPPGARLVLVGDADQLPAVDAGSVFRDLAPFALRLAESHRMDPTDPAGAAVLDAARAIAGGDLGARGTPAFERPAELPAAGLACLDPGTGAAQARRLVAAFVDHWYATHLRPDARDGGARGVFTLQAEGGFLLEDARTIDTLLDRQRRLRLLTVTREGFAGSTRINETLARRFAADAGLSFTAGDLPPGTPVLMTHNDYERGLYNGEEGLIVRAGGGPGGPRSFAVFPRGDTLAPFPLSSLRAVLEVAYASTVHKAQGSELDHAALILPDADLPLLTRELIYTAVTRVRRSITVVGQRALLDRAIARPLERSSGLGARLVARDAPARKK